MTNALVTQAGIEGVVDGSPNVRLAQAGIEAVIDNTTASSVLFVQCGIEVVCANQPPSPAITDILDTIFPFTNYQLGGGLRGLAWPVMKTAEFGTVISSSASFYEARVQNAVNPVWHWTQVWNYLKDNPKDLPALYAPATDYEVLQGFYEQQTGEAASFLFSDPSDNYVGPALIANPPWRVNWTPIPGAIIVVAGYTWQATTVTGPTGWSIPAFSGSTQSDGGVTWTKGIAASAVEPNPSAQLQFFGDGAYWYSPVQRNFGGQFLEDVTDLNTTAAIGGSTLGVFINGLLMQSAGYLVLGPGLDLPSMEYFYGLYVRFDPWQAFTNYSIGNLFIDPAGHLQQATTNGEAGPLSPPWNDSGGNTRDGSVYWQDLGLATTVTAQFNFFFRVRFETDELDFEEFLSQVWTAGGPDTRNGMGYLKLQTARPLPLPPCPCCQFAAHHF